MRNIVIILSCLFFHTGCDILESIGCSSEDISTVNTIIVREYITDQNFQTFTPLRVYQYGDKNTLNVIGKFDYTLDGSFAIMYNGYINYGADPVSFNEEFLLHTFGDNYSPNGFVSNYDDVDYNNVQEQFIRLYSSLKEITFPGTERPTPITVDMVNRFSKFTNSVDTLFYTTINFSDSTTYFYNRIQDLEYGKDGSPLLLINDKKVVRIDDNNRNEQLVSSHIIKVGNDAIFDTLYSYNPLEKTNNQLYFSSTNAGIFIRKLDEFVYLLNDDGSLTTSYLNQKLGFTPDRSNLKGTSVISDYGGHFYDLEKDKHIDLTKLFYDTNQVIYGYPSNNDLIALMLSGTSGLNTNEEKIFIFDAISETLIDSITVDDLLPFDSTETNKSSSITLKNPVFTSDNRLIFMQVFTTWDEYCND